MVHKEAYLFSDNDCNKMYLCKKKFFNLFDLGDDVHDCYYRNEEVPGSFGPGVRKEPDECPTNGHVAMY